MKKLTCSVWYAAALAVSAGAAAQTYPAKPVRLIVGFAPGGGTDIIARTLAQRLTDFFGHTFVVDNRAGAGGVVGAEIVARSNPDGYTLLMGTPGPLTINPNLRKQMPYTLEDFAPVGMATVSPFILCVHAGLAASSVKELIALAKAKPGTLNFGSAGNGSVSHLSGEQFKALAGINITHVPYKGSSQALTDLLGGQVQIVIENMPVMLPHIRSGKVRALAVGTKKRSALVPEFPTMVEAGVAGYEASTASGLLAPRATPRDIVRTLNAAMVKAVQSPDLKERLGQQGVEAVGTSPDDYAQHLRAELAQVARVIKSAGIKVE